MTVLPLDKVHKAQLQQNFASALLPGQIMESLFDAIPGVFFFVKDVDGRFMGGSLSFVQTMGETSVDALIGKNDYDYSPDFLADAFLKDDQWVINNGKPIKDKIELVPSADGSLDWLCTTKIPLFSRDGTAIGLAGVARIIRDSDGVYADHPEMRLIVNYVRNHYHEKLSVASIARVGGVSVSKQERLFRRFFGLTPLMYLQRTRLNAACSMLRDSKDNLSQIAIDCGFNDQTSMTRAFRLELKITPLKYRRRFSEAKFSRKGNAATVALFPRV